MKKDLIKKTIIADFCLIIATTLNIYLAKIISENFIPNYFFYLLVLLNSMMSFFCIFLSVALNMRLVIELFPD